MAHDEDIEEFRRLWERAEEHYIDEARVNFQHLWLAGEEARLEELLLFTEVGFDTTRDSRFQAAWKPNLERLKSGAAERFEEAWRLHCEEGE